MSRDDPVAPLIDYMTKKEAEESKKRARRRVAVSWFIGIIMVSSLTKYMFANLI